MSSFPHMAFDPFLCGADTQRYMYMIWSKVLYQTLGVTWDIA